MAEDKRIRVSADASPLQELRQEAQALWNDFNKMENSFKNLAEDTVEIIQKQIDLLKERNTLAAGVNMGGQRNTPSTGQVSLIDPYTGRPLRRDNIIPGAPNRTTDRGLFDPSQRTDRVQEDPTTVSPGASDRITNANDLTERQDDVLRQILSEVTRIADLIERSDRQETDGVLPSAGGGEPPVPPETPESPETPVPENRGGAGGGLLGKGFKLPTSMAGLMGLLPFGALLMGVGTILGQQAKFDARQYGAENEFQRQNNVGNHWLLNMLTFGISGANAEKSEVGRLAAAQNDRSLNNYASLHNLSYRGALASQLTSSFDEERIEAVTARDEDRRENKGFLNWLGKVGMMNIASDPHVGYETREQMSNELDRKREISRNAKRAEERTGGAVSEDEYHTWASETLGLNITDYIDKVANLQRAGVYGRNTSLGDVNQLLMAGRIRGLSEDDAASVLATTRFDRSGRTGANVVQAFDTNLQARGKDDQYIASTLGEYLQQFNRVAEQVLGRTGTINTAEIVRSMTSIQNATGMEGRQLDRVQNSLMGNNISQDDVTQALLLRTAREVNGGEGNLSDLQAMIEEMPQNTELQTQFFERIQKMTGGGEMGRQVMKQIFPNLSMRDIIDLEGKTGMDAEKIFKRGRSTGAEYSEENARSKVGDAERSSAGTTNRKIIDGYSEILDEKGTNLKAVLESLEKPIPVMVVQAPAGSAGAPLPQGFIGPPTYNQATQQVLEELKGLRRDFKNITIQE